MIKLIHVENKIDIKDIAKVLTETRKGSAMECLTIIKSFHQGMTGDYSTFISDPAVQQIAKMHCINLNQIN